MSQKQLNTGYSRRWLAVAIAFITMLGSTQFAGAGASEPEPGLLKAVTVTNGSLATVGNTLYFTAPDGLNGIELWKSDGTEAGTLVVRDINPGVTGSSPASLTAVGNKLYFTANVTGLGRELWTSDGTFAGTVLVKDIVAGNPESTVGNLTAVGSTLYFTANDGVNGVELWKSNGTEAGTVLVADINTGSLSSSPQNLTAVGESLYFTAISDTVGRELWKTDGTPEGTELVIDIRSGATSSTPDKLTAVGGTLFFTADDGVNGVELWKSDGTTTALVKDIRAGFLPSSPDNLARIGSTLYFSANNAVSNVELWKSDGTESGTVLLKDINPSGSSTPQFFTLAGENIFFVSSDGSNGNELWKTNGTSEGTVIVKDIVEGSGSSFPIELRAVGTYIYFRANSEVWKSDGTDSGTRRVSSVNLSNLRLAGDNMFFRAPSTNQLWSFNVASDLAVVIPPVATPSSDSGISVAPTPLATNTPQAAKFGDTITIFGSNLDLVSEVLIGGIRAPITSKAASRIQIRAPRGLSGLVDVEFRSSRGNALLAKHLNFGTQTSVLGSVKEKMVISGFSPNSKKLTKKMKTRIDSWLDLNFDLTKLTCTGFTSLPRRATDVALSTSRGAMACRYAMTQRPDLEASASRGIEDKRLGSDVRRVRLVLTQ